MSEATIHDIGYRPYDGPRLGRAYAVRALTVHGLRTAFGLGRPARTKIIPVFLSVAMLVPIVIFIGIMAFQGEGPPLPYTAYIVIMQVVVAIFVATQGPAVIGPDLRFGVLPLYLARPGTRGDYLLARFAALFVALLLLVTVPLTVLFVGELLIAPPVPLHVVEYVQALAGAIPLAGLLSAGGLAIASFTRRRGLGVAAVIAVYVLAAAVSGILQGLLLEAGSRAEASWALLLNPFGLVDAIQVQLLGAPAFGELGYAPATGPAGLVILIGLVAVSFVLLSVRYRKVASR